jgi:hypothetical protein
MFMTQYSKSLGLKCYDFELYSFHRKHYFNYSYILCTFNKKNCT